MNEIRVLILSNMYPHFMGGTFVHYETVNLIKHGCKATVVVPVPYCPSILKLKEKWKVYANIPRHDIIDDVSVYYPRYIRIPGQWFHAISCYNQYLGLLKTVSLLIMKFRPNLIHAHSATVPGYLGLLLKRKYNIPLVCSFRGSDINIYPYHDKLSMYLTKKVITEADLLLSVSEALKAAAMKIAKPRRVIQVINTGCDLNSFSRKDDVRMDIREKHCITEHEKVLIFIGRITEDKGIFELAMSFRNLASRHNNLRLLIVGDGPSRTALATILTSFNLNNNVIFVGEVNHNDVANYLSVADIFILPSYSEGLPNVVLEAMACNLPIVATRVGGIPEIVEDGKNGILVQKKDVDSLEKAIDYMLLNEKVAQEMGAVGRNMIENRSSWAQSAAIVSNLYKDLLYGSN